VFATRTRLTGLLGVLGVIAVLLAGCGGSSSGSSAKRPTTKARMQIVAPTPNAVTGPDFTVKVDVKGGRVVKQTTGKLTPDEGHVHLTLDGKGYVMSYGDQQDFRNVAAGQHSLLAEFVAKDHAPFTNRPRAFVRFNVEG
jgi:hypothetical protein